MALLHLLVSAEKVDHLSAEGLARTHGLPLDLCRSELEDARTRLRA